MAKRSYVPKTYGAYRFRDKDPEIDRLRTMIQDEYGFLNNTVLRDIEDNGGPSATSMHNWFMGDTYRPQNPTMEACGRSMGYRRDWVKMQDYKKKLLKRTQRSAKKAKRKSANGHG
jgi:hypothetical protein